jgi:hypothetical protein
MLVNGGKNIWADPENQHFQEPWFANSERALGRSHSSFPRSAQRRNLANGLHRATALEA